MDKLLVDHVAMALGGVRLTPEISTGNVTILTTDNVYQLAETAIEAIKSYKQPVNDTKPELPQHPGG